MASDSPVRHRALWVISGQRGWGRQKAVNWLTERLAERPHFAAAWLGDQPPENIHVIARAHVSELLGSEWDLLVFDSFTGFDPDAFGALTGTVRAGGALLLLTPSLAGWPHYSDPCRSELAAFGWHADQVAGRFIARFIRLLGEDPRIQCYQQTAATQLPEPSDLIAPRPLPGLDPMFRSQDQRRAVNAVLAAAGRRRKPALLFADRGRGKSAALGIAAGLLINQGQRVWLTGPGKVAVATAVQHARAVTDLRSGVNKNEQVPALAFKPADVLLAMDSSDCDLLLIDEAAALPLPLLVALCERYSRCAFATTVHGYEGSGRGFQLRFIPAIQAHVRGTTCIRLDEPIRWSRNDPVEDFTHKALLLDCEPSDLPNVERLSLAQTHYRLIHHEELIGDEQLLRQAFGLLVNAHYRTRPSDLRQMLDSPTIRWHVLSADQQIVAVAIVAGEGALAPAICQALWLGERRPIGHLLSEILAIHLGLREAGGHSAARIMRIAVHPAVRRRGFGRKLLTALADDPNLAADYLGASYALSDGTLAFWRACGYSTVRVGYKFNAASAARSVLSLRPITAAGATLIASARNTFKRNFWRQLSDPAGLATLSSHTVLELLAQLEDLTGPAPALTASRREDLIAYAFGHKPLSSAIDAVNRYCQWALCAQQRQNTLNPCQRHALVGHILQQRSAQSLGIKGRRQLDQGLRSGTALLLREHSDVPLHSAINTLLKRSAN